MALILRQDSAAGFSAASMRFQMNAVRPKVAAFHQYQNPRRAFQGQPVSVQQTAALRSAHRTVMKVETLRVGSVPMKSGSIGDSGVSFSTLPSTTAEGSLKSKCLSCGRMRL
jgi:hypothetical protein